MRFPQQVESGSCKHIGIIMLDLNIILKLIFLIYWDCNVKFKYHFNLDILNILGLWHWI